MKGLSVWCPHRGLTEATWGPWGVDKSVIGAVSDVTASCEQCVEHPSPESIPTRAHGAAVLGPIS